MININKLHGRISEPKTIPKKEGFCGGWMVM